MIITKNILIIGFGIDKNRTEAVSKNVLKHVKNIKDIGHKAYLYNIGYPNKYFDTGKGFLYSIIRRRKIISDLNKFIRQNEITHLTDVFVLPLSSIIFTIPLKRNNPHVVFIKEIHNDAGFSNKLHIETLIRLFSNNIFLFRFIINFFDKIFTKNLELSMRYNIKYIQTFIKTFNHKKIKNKKLNICYLGHPLKKKGIYELLKIFSLMPEKFKKNLIFNIAFSKIGPYKQVEDMFKKEANLHNIEIHFFNTVKVHHFFRKNDVYILPIEDEYGAISTPNTILEAMEAGTLVITNNIRSLLGIVEDKKNILLLKNNSGFEIIKTLIPVINKIDKFKDITKSARKLIITNYNKNIVLKKIKELYE
jgi:glycosyltransferase involved in cell wall biosynthesis